MPPWGFVHCSSEHVKGLGSRWAPSPVWGRERQRDRQPEAPEQEGLAPIVLPAPCFILKLTQEGRGQPLPFEKQMI